MVRRIIVALVAVLSLASVGTAAAASFIDDGAGLFSASAVTRLDARLQNFTAQTGKQIVVITVPSLNGEPIEAAARTAYEQRAINGFLIFIDAGGRKDLIVPDRAAIDSGWFTPDEIASLRRTMESEFRAGDFDAGIEAVVNGLLAVYHSHLSSLPAARGGAQPVPYAANGVPVGAQSVPVSRERGGHTPWLLIIIFIVIAYLVVRSILRAMQPPIAYGPGGPQPPVPPGGPVPPSGYGGYGYGGYGGWGGGFFSSLLGGLGGYWLGSQLFGSGGGGGGGMISSAQAAPLDSGMPAPDASGWAADPGQADFGAASSGDFGGGGFGDPGGGFGGGDFGGGGGDFGGGW